MSIFVTFMAVKAEDDGTLTERPLRLRADAILSFERRTTTVGNRIVTVTSLQGCWHNMAFVTDVRETPDMIESMIEKAAVKDAPGSVVLNEAAIEAIMKHQKEV